MNETQASIIDLVLEQAAQRMADDIDREILWGMLEESGWIRITLESLQSNKRAIDIREWLDKNCENCCQSGRQFLFKNKKDAVLFVLHWAS